MTIERCLVKCECNKCGINTTVFYDTLNDYYICSDCLELEVDSYDNRERKEDEQFNSEEK